MDGRRLGLLTGAAIGFLSGSMASAPAAANTGPFNTTLIAGGPGLAKPIDGTPLPFTLHGWVETDANTSGLVRIAGIGEDARSLSITLRDGRLALQVGKRSFASRIRLTSGAWHFVAATLDANIASLYLDGERIVQGKTDIAVAGGMMQIGPRDGNEPGFSGRIAGLTLEPRLLAPVELESLANHVPDVPLIQFEQASPHWPVQTRQMQGQINPQDAWTLPRSAATADPPHVAPLPDRPVLESMGEGHWAINGWTLAAAPAVQGDGATFSKPGTVAGKWLPATVPGTVLTTLVDRGVYSDPAHGLNNLAIPESLAHQDYWYRTEFDLPAAAARRRLELLLNGVNYASVVWVNGKQIGTTKGAFVRGRFDVGPLLHSGRNAIAIYVSPPPHVGLAHEESLTAGVGENGGMMMLDGPTFGASEGWDWIPTIRDRNTGLWQGIDLIASGDVRIGDAQVITTLPRADNTVANVEIDVPLVNLSERSVTVLLHANFDDVAVARSVLLAPGEIRAEHLTPTDYPALSVHNPKLWWPNGYGDPALHMLHLTASVDDATSDTKNIRFGMREVTYEMSLVDGTGALRRVGLDLSKARTSGQPIVDTRHEAIRQVPNGWAYSLAPGASASPAVTPIAGDQGLSPFLIIRVNGVRIAARGGSIGMDDFMKRVDRARLEPFFALHRDAHMNIVRNWIGQDTEENFFDLADEYGMMVLNDFWESTQDYNLEAQDVPLFLQNAEDVVKRFRNHPSIVVWFGRNEGVPQPILNEGLDALIRKDDGTRLYMSSSNRINLHDSGPYNWRPPEKYFTEYSKGFAVEVGTPSFPTLEAWERAIPASERWPISDSWAYHDWHQAGNGAVTSFTDALAREFGPATSLPDFERKAQMLEYESYRAIFEGMNAGLWTTNSGRMLWMTQPAWPSSAWQIFSSDYDTHGAFYGVKKASESVHVQMNLPDHKVVLVNNGMSALGPVTVRALVESLDGTHLAERNTTVSAVAGSVVDAYDLQLDPFIAAGPIFIRLEALDQNGSRLSDNFYWQAKNDSDLQALNKLPTVTLVANATAKDEGDECVLTVLLSNTTQSAALETKLTLFDGTGKQVLPAYFSDNYLSLLPGETRTVTIRAAKALAGPTPSIRLRGFNVTPSVISSGATL